MRSIGFSITLIASQLLFGLTVSFSSKDVLAKQNSQPQRIITLAPHLSELVDAAGGADRLIGVSAYSNNPDTVKNLPIVSDARSIDLEKMKSLRPDLIIYWRGGLSENLVASVKKTFGPTSKLHEVQIISVEPKKLEDIAQNIEMIGDVLGTSTEAKKSAEKFRAQVTSLKTKFQNPQKRKVRVFYQVWAQPLMTLNQDHLISDIIQICGGEQLFAQEKLLVPTVSRESVVVANPEIILTAVDGKRMKQDWSMWSSIPQLAATRNKAFVEIDGDTISRASPRILEGALKICTEIDRLR